MAKIDSKFKKFINYLKDQAKRSADYLRQQGPTTNENLGGSEAPERTGGNNFNAAAVHDHFSRQDLYQAYIQSIEQSKTTAEAITAKLQADFLAGLERDYKLKRLTRVRSCMIEASRRFGHGNDNGVIQQGIYFQVEAMASRNGPKDPAVTTRAPSKAATGSDSGEGGGGTTVA